MVTVYRTYEDGAYHYEDDYGNIGVRPLYESRVREFTAQSFPESGIKVFSDIRNSGRDTDGQSVTEENVLQTVSAVTYIFISESVCTEEQFRDFIREMCSVDGKPVSGCGCADLSETDRCGTSGS